MKKVSGYALTMLLTAATVLTGCGGQTKDEKPKDEGGQSTTESAKENESGDSSDEQITLKLFHNWINVDETPYFEDLAAEFESTHPNVDIVIENVGDPDYKSKLKVMLGADDAPDIFFFVEW